MSVKRVKFRMWTTGGGVSPIYGSADRLRENSKMYSQTFPWESLHSCISRGFPPPGNSRRWKWSQLTHPAAGCSFHPFCWYFLCSLELRVRLFTSTENWSLCVGGRDREKEERKKERRVSCQLWSPHNLNTAHLLWDARVSVPPFTSKQKENTFSLFTFILKSEQKLFIPCETFSFTICSFR